MNLKQFVNRLEEYKQAELATFVKERDARIEKMREMGGFAYQTAWAFDLVKQEFVVQGVVGYTDMLLRIVEEQQKAGTSQADIFVALEKGVAQVAAEVLEMQLRESGSQFNSAGVMHNAVGKAKLEALDTLRQYKVQNLASMLAFAKEAPCEECYKEMNLNRPSRLVPVGTDLKTAFKRGEKPVVVSSCQCNHLLVSYTPK